MPQIHRPINVRKWLRSLLIFCLGLVVFGTTTGFVVLDCRPPSGKPVNSNQCNSLIGGAGDSHITVDKDQTVVGPFFGDGVLGSGGNDVLINNGTTISEGGGTGRNGDIEGDVATGNGGDDVIVNNGVVASDIDGDTALGSGGNDVLINNGSTGDDIDGDNARKNGGDDLIINNGTVGGDIQADDNEGTANSQGGNDTIVINGIVEGSVDGDAGVTTGGDDTVILQNGANGSSDHDLYITGNDGDDTLVFNFTVSDQAILDDLSKQIADANPRHGSLTYNGQRFEWENFEHLDDGVVIKGMTGAFIVTLAGKTRAALDPNDAAIYCAAGKLTALGLDSDNRGEWLFNIKGADLKAGLARASSSKASVSIAEFDGQTLSALPSGKLSLVDAQGRYDFTLAGNTCAD